MKSRLVDPIHFFDARGRSYLSYDELVSRIATLEIENEKLRRIALRFKNLSGWQPAAETSPVVH